MLQRQSCKGSEGRRSTHHKMGNIFINIECLMHPNCTTSTEHPRQVWIKFHKCFLCPCRGQKAGQRSLDFTEGFILISLTTTKRTLCHSYCYYQISLLLLFLIVLFHHFLRYSLLIIAQINPCMSVSCYFTN